MPLVWSQQSRVDSGEGPGDLLSTLDARRSTRVSDVSSQQYLKDRSMTCRAGAEPRLED